MKKLIGGQALRNLGSSRYTNDVDFLTFDENDSRLFINSSSCDIINAANHPFYKEIWEASKDEIVSPELLLEMCCFTFVQHCINGFWDKADCKEFDIKFLVRLIGKDTKVEIVNKYISTGEMAEVQKVINSVKF